MQFSVSVKRLFMGLGILAISAATVSAQSLSGVTARLVTPLNSQTAKVGEPVTAKLDRSVKIANGDSLPKGTELAGNLSAVQSAEGRSAASVSIVFTVAELKSGKKIPIKATLLRAYPPSVNSNSGEGDELADPTPAQVSSEYAVDQEPGALHDIALNAAVANPNSGTFSKKSGNFKLASGSYLEIGVAPAGAGNATGAAE